jgi:hypothetical protein
MVERQLPKLHTRVRFPSPAPVFLSQMSRLGLRGCGGWWRANTERTFLDVARHHGSWERVPSMRIWRGISQWISRENIEWLYRLLKPKTHNKLAWLVVGAGVAILASPFWEPILRGLALKYLQIQIDPPTSPILGFALVVVGLLYHYGLSRIEHYPQDAQQRERRLAAIEHDRRLAQTFRDTITETQLENLFFELETNHMFANNSKQPLQNATELLGTAEMHFLNPLLRDCATNFIEASEQLTGFLALNFFVYPERQRELRTFALHPHLNWDRGAPNDEQAGQYQVFAEQLDELVAAMREAYGNLIISFHEQL